MIEVVPAVLRSTFEQVQEDWDKVVEVADHVQLDVADGVFVGNETFRQVREFKKLRSSERAELHMMVHNPAYWVDDVIDLNPAKCVFHLEAFVETGDVRETYMKLRGGMAGELALALNPDSPNEYLDEYVDLIDYVLFLGVNPGWANQPFKPEVYRKVGAWHDKHPDMPIAVDGAVNKETVREFAKAGATILCANTAIFGAGNPAENMEQLRLLAEAAIEE